MSASSRYGCAVQDGPQPFTVLVVDDDASVCRSVARLLRASGYAVQTFSRAAAFLAAVGPKSRGCVLLDVTMPRMSGLEAQVVLRARGIALPVIALSARDSSQVRERARERGAQFFLQKPVDDQALLDAIAWVTQLPAAPAAPAGAQ